MDLLLAQLPSPVAEGESKRLLLAALTASVATVFPFLCEMLQQHFMAAMASQQEGAAEKLVAHSS
ncbi:Xpo1 domain-containing protein, partial [Haematococcus lacustris]